MNQYNLNLDLDKGPLRSLGSDYGGVTLRQGDRQGCVIAADLYDHGVRFTTAGLTAFFVMELPDHAHYYCAGCTYSEGTVSVTVDERYAASVPGKTVGYFELRQGDTVIASTRSFGVTVLEDAREGHTAGESYDSRIDDLIAALTAALAAAQAATADATSAATSATSAASSATSAATSATSAASSANSAATSATSAATSATNAASAATTATSNANAAATAAQTATTNANAATTAAQTATTNANTATAAAQDATRRADEAAARMGYNAYLDFHEVEGKRYLSVVVPQE